MAVSSCMKADCKVGHQESVAVISYLDVAVPLVLPSWYTGIQLAYSNPQPAVTT